MKYTMDLARYTTRIMKKKMADSRRFWVKEPSHSEKKKSQKWVFLYRSTRHFFQFH